MKKSKNLQIYIIILSLAGILSSILLPWSRLYMGSIPPGNIPDKIYYGYEKIGLYSLIPLVILFCLTVFSLIKKSSCKYFKYLSILLNLITLGICLFDIIRIKVKYKGMVGTIPIIEKGPFVIALISVLILIILLCIPIEKSNNTK
ncbi:hypothetical protein [Parvimonas micra]|uniref:DUF1648 domain-containing protein n=1 Tax=Parvimonas micra ATCC 33270 TaxID=411465 RepID=A8SNE7_9FIRM|nr:hypothetical protein [Parvimonas micra]EDP23841.1 hypothetical protein PEPMIC_01647 [Parvimonas micra ATCC 33270]RSB91210.1 hypothetical protein EGS00_05615 [Parvimonas micra]VEH94637.1 Uncharacterised protein [Parvimonas micra]